MQKSIYIIRENDLTYGRGYVYSLQYHIVWCTKYRKKILKDGIDEAVKQMLLEIAEEYHFKILAMEVMPDHIHLLLDCRPQFVTVQSQGNFHKSMRYACVNECFYENFSGGYATSRKYAVFSRLALNGCYA